MMSYFFPLFRNRNELAETLALLKAQIDPVLLKNSSQQDNSSRESPSLEEEETKKEEETPKQGFFCVFCFVISSLFFTLLSNYLNWNFLNLKICWASCKRRLIFILVNGGNNKKEIEYFVLYIGHLENLNENVQIIKTVSFTDLRI